jgi:FkbM family methyltransferase
MRDSSVQRHPLERVFAAAGSAEHLRRREADAFSRLSGGLRKAVIFGCGVLGKMIYAGARRAGVDVVGFADNSRDLQGRCYEGVPILSPSDAYVKHGKSAYFVVGVFNASGPQHQLQSIGCQYVVPYAVFCWEFAASMPDAPGVDLPHRIIDRGEEVCAGYDCLTDDKSRSEFAAQIASRCSLEFDRLPPYDDAADIYFPRDLIELSSDEVFVDCGAFDGDSIRLFRVKTAGAYRRIYACEPDTSNRAALQRFIASLHVPEQSRITVLPFAIGDHDGAVYFDASGTAASRLSADRHTQAIECRKLDTLLNADQPTIIKMDIEGAEPDAIAGATGTIRRARPILAVCAYHKNEHLWTLPTLIKAALPDYRISLRRYAEECWETVYYAVPPERALQDA